jgi:hypothetical protein
MAKPAIQLKSSIIENNIISGYPAGGQPGGVSAGVTIIS